MNSPDKYEILQIYILPIDNVAALIEQQFGECLIDPEPGIYRIGEIKPCIFNNRRYFSQNVNQKIVGTLEPITDFNKVTDAVYDEYGNMILSDSVMKNKDKYLRNTPTVPSRGLMLLELLVKNHIDSIAPWVRHSMYKQKIYNLFKPEHIDVYNNGQIDLLCQSIFLRVSDIIGKDIWNIYFVKFISFDLMIEKSCDYRVLQWEQEHGNEFRR